MPNLTDIERIPKDLLTIDDIAEYLGSDPQDIRNQAHLDPVKLGFPVVVAGKRVKIPKDGFVHCMRYGWSVMAQPERSAP